MYDGLAAPHVLHLDDGAHAVHVVDKHELAPRILCRMKKCDHG